MTCHSCGATIADKAIVCYRCGAPTAIPALNRPERRAPSPWPAVAALLVFIALLGWLAWTLPAASVERTIAIGGVVAAVAALVWRLLRKR